MVKNGSLLANETILKVKISECGLTDEEWKLKFQDLEQQRGIGQIKNENCIVWIKSNLEDKESFEEKSDQMRIPWLCGGPCVAMMASQQSIPWAVWRPLCSHDGYTAIDSLAVWKPCFPGCVKSIFTWMCEIHFTCKMWKPYSLDVWNPFSLAVWMACVAVWGLCDDIAVWSWWLPCGPWWPLWSWSSWPRGSWWWPCWP